MADQLSGSDDQVRRNPEAFYANHAKAEMALKVFQITGVDASSQTLELLADARMNAAKVLSDYLA